MRHRPEATATTSASFRRRSRLLRRQEPRSRHETPPKRVRSVRFLRATVRATEIWFHRRKRLPSSRSVLESELRLPRLQLPRIRAKLRPRLTWVPERDAGKSRRSTPMSGQLRTSNLDRNRTRTPKTRDKKFRARAHHQERRPRARKRKPARKNILHRAGTVPRTRRTRLRPQLRRQSLRQKLRRRKLARRKRRHRHPNRKRSSSGRRDFRPNEFRSWTRGPSRRRAATRRFSGTTSRSSTRAENSARSPFCRRRRPPRGRRRPPISPRHRPTRPEKAGAHSGER